MDTAQVAKPHERIREDILKTVTDSRIRSILSSHFSAKPSFEDHYFEYISSRPEYFEIYKRWVLGKLPISIPNDEDMYRVRRGIFEDVPPNSGGEGTFKINRRLLFFLVDLLFPYVKNAVAHALQYYGDEVKPKASFDDALVEAAGFALQFSSKEDIEREGYPDFSGGFMPLFRAGLARQIGYTQKLFSSDSALFVQEFENEWKRLHPYSDYLYGFEVMPVFSPQDVFRYLRIPFDDRKIRSLSETETYKQVMNYVAAIATFKPAPDSRIRVYYRQELCKLFTPLIMSEIRRVVRAKLYKLSPDSLKIELEKRLLDLAGGFNYCHATFSNLKKGDPVAANSLIMPIRGWLIKLEHIYSSKEYPFTAYVTDQLRKCMKIFVAKDLPSEHARSLDEALDESWGEEGRTLLDTIEDPVDTHVNEIPPYDAQDASGVFVGWKIETFARITGKGKTTLRRWDRSGALKSQRYDIHSRQYHKKIRYRFYTEEDLVKAREVDQIMRGRMRHKK